MMRPDRGVLMPSIARQFCLSLLLLMQLARGGASALAADECKNVRDGASWMQWLEGSKPRGARLVFNDQWQEAHFLHGHWLRYEPTNTRVAGWLRLGLPPFMPAQESEKLKADLGIQGLSQIEAALHPALVEIAVQPVKGTMDPSGIFSLTQPQPITVLGLDALGRVVGAKTSDRVIYGTALAANPGCFSLFGIFSASDGRQLSVDELEFLNSTIRVEWYEPPAAAPLTSYSARPLLPQGTSILEALREAGSAPFDPRQ